MGNELMTLQELLKYGGTEILVYEGTGITADKDTKATPIPVMAFKEADFFLYVSSLTGDKTVDVSVLSKMPGVDQWVTLATFTQVTNPGGGGIANGTQKKAIAANLGSQLAVFVDLSAATTATVKIAAVLKAR